MKSFWISLLVFILFMCSCKTKKVAHDINVGTKESVQTEQIKFHALIDTSNVLKTYIDKSKLKIIETITITEYDKETGKQIKKTNAKREVTQDTDQVAAEAEDKGVNEFSKDSLNHQSDVISKVESEVKEEFIGGQESFGKWLGIGISIIILIILIILWSKIKKWLNL